MVPGDTELFYWLGVNKIRPLVNTEQFRGSQDTVEKGDIWFKIYIGSQREDADKCRLFLSSKFTVDFFSLIENTLKDTGATGGHRYFNFCTTIWKTLKNV